MFLSILINEYTWLCIQASPNKLGDGDVSSNLRFKGDNQKNNEGCEKWAWSVTEADIACRRG